MANLPLPKHGKYFDLNVPSDEAVSTVSKRLTMLVYLGYEIVALTKFLPTTTSSKGKKKLIIPDPPSKVQLEETAEKILKDKGAELLQYTRITIELAELDDVRKVREVLNAGVYDLVAVLPRTEKLFHSCCTEYNIDIICIDGSEPLPYIPRHNAIKSAITRGLFFEVCYAPMIRNNTVRRHTISNVQKFAEFSKGKNHIMSGAAQIPMEVRGPYDVANINTLFCVAKNIVTHTVSKNCRAAVVHGFSRKTAKCAIYVQKKDIVTEDREIVKGKENNMKKLFDNNQNSPPLKKKKVE
uniref:Ribonuclease P protein subunit p30-like n=1 Tax=Phallusia mammillata TaxID=59560 RepID=A0A6F9DQL6_9ASCI|nr:ribonuclease P protein subunit p30-like [Phallusia mammillata]